MESFWRRWNEVAHERELLLAAGAIDWDAVKETLQMSNLLLINSPDRDIQRIVRLAQIPQYYDLDEKDRLIYVILGPHPPYNMWDGPGVLPVLGPWCKDTESICVVYEC